MADPSVIAKQIDKANLDQDQGSPLRLTPTDPIVNTPVVQGASTPSHAAESQTEHKSAVGCCGTPAKDHERRSVLEADEGVPLGSPKNEIHHHHHSFGDIYAEQGSKDQAAVPSKEEGRKGTLPPMSLQAEQIQTKLTGRAEVAAYHSGQFIRSPDATRDEDTHHKHGDIYVVGAHTKALPSNKTPELDWPAGEENLTVEFEKKISEYCMLDGLRLDSRLQISESKRGLLTGFRSTIGAHILTANEKGKPPVQYHDGQDVQLLINLHKLPEGTWITLGLSKWASSHSHIYA